MEKVKRKTRSDKKRDVKPTISISLYECISRISYITSTPIKNVAEFLCIEGLKSKPVIEYLSKDFRRSYRFKNTIFCGDLYRKSIRVIKKDGINRRISIRFSQAIYEEISKLAFALDITVSSATALLLDASVKNPDILNCYLENFFTQTLDEQRKKQLKYVYQYIKKENPYTEEITFAQFISFLFDELMESTKTFKQAIMNWLDHVIDNNKKT